MDEFGVSAGLSEAMRSRFFDFCLIAGLSGTDLLVFDAVNGNILACNPSAHERLKYSSTEMLALSHEAIQADPAHDASWAAERHREVLSSGDTTYRTRHRCRDGSILDVVVSNTVVELDGQTLIVSCVRDETQQHRREIQLEDTLRLLDDGAAISGIGVWELRFVDGRLRWSEQMRRLCRWQGGTDFSSLQAYEALVHPDDRLRWQLDFRRAVNRGDMFQSCHRLSFEDGTELMVQEVGHVSYDESGAPMRMVGTLRDLTDEHSLVQQLTAERSCDPLTGLPNKLASLEELNRRLRGRSYNASLAVLSLDVDGFQAINENFGSDVGDQVLQSIASRLRAITGPKDWLARLSSDQFLIVMEEGIGSIGDAMKAAQRLQQNWSQQQRLLKDLPLHPTFSVGIATFPEHAQESQTLIQCANTALMKAKTHGRIQVCAYSSTISRKIQERMELGSQLSAAIEREEFRLLVQPLLDRSSVLSGGEILLRWNHQLSISMPTSQFMQLAEESGQIFQLSAWVMRQTLQQISAWQNLGLQPPRLALNVSPRELERPGRHFISALMEAMREYKLNPEQLELEITESALIRNPLLAREQLRVLAEQGFRIVLDNFGTGYSSLELLRTLPMHRLKIDRIFVKDIAASTVDQTIVTTAITLAHGLGMDCVAEGVETEAQRRILEDLGCDCFQGFLCGHPLELQDFESLLKMETPTASQDREQRSRATSERFLHLDPPGDSAGVPSTFEQLRLLRRALDNSNDYFFLLQPIYHHNGSIEDFQILDVNQASCAALRQDREAIVGQMLLTILPQVSRNGLMELYVDAALRNVPSSFNGFVSNVQDSSLGSRTFDIEITPDQGNLVVTWRDVSERQQALRNLGDAAALYRLLADNIVDVMLLLNRLQQVVWVSPSLQTMTGWQQKQWLGRTFHELFATADDPAEPVDLDHWLAESGPIRQGRLRLSDPKGGWSWVQLSVRQFNREELRHLNTMGLATSGEVEPVGASLSLEHGYVITLQPVDQQVLEERLLLQRANTDPLTGLYSRAAILGQLEQELLDERACSAQPLALLFCDCDDFKGINDRYGHACGDAVLKTVAQRINAQIRRSDHAGRIGGDEFLVLLEGIQSLDDAVAIAEKLQTSVNEPISWSDATITASFSIGVALHGAGEDADLFLNRADRNMYAAKAAGRHRVVAL